MSTTPPITPTTEPTAETYAAAANVLQKGIAFHQAENFKEAESCYNQALALIPHHPDAHHLLGIMAMQLGKLDLAIELIEKAIATHDQQPAYFNNLGQALMKTRQFSRAVDAYTTAITLQPDFAPAYLGLGNGLQELERYEEALQAYDSALTHQPQFPQAYYNKGLALAAIGRHVKAENAYRAAISQRPNYPEALGNLGNTLRAQGLLNDALNAYQQSLRHQPNNALTLNSCGTVMRELGQFDKALAAYARALKINPTHSQTHNNMANILKTQGKLDAAIDAYRAGITCQMEATTPPKPRAKPYMDIKQAEQALQALKSALDGAGISFFLAYGTLLGIIRDGTLLPHDKDMDIGLAWDVDRAAVTKLLTQHGFIKSNVAMQVYESDRWSMTFVHPPTKIEIDLFFFKPDGEVLLSGLHHLPTPLIWRFSTFGTQPIEYLGDTWQVPSPPEKYLEEIYGANWREPDAYFDSLISGHNREENALEVARCFAYNRLFERISRAEWAKAEGYCRQLLAKSEDAFITRVASWLKTQTSEGMPS